MRSIAAQSGEIQDFSSVVPLLRTRGMPDTSQCKFVQRVGVHEAYRERVSVSSRDEGMPILVLVCGENWELVIDDGGDGRTDLVSSSLARGEMLVPEASVGADERVTLAAVGVLNLAW